MADGEEQAFERFVRSASPRLFRTAYLIAGNLETAEDLLQAALEKVYRQWARVNAMEYPEAFVRRIMVNLANDRWRGRRFAVELPLDEFLFRPDQVEPDPADLIDLRQSLAAGLRRLPVRMRTVLVLRYWVGLSEAETATELRCSVGTVKSQSSRGLARLREIVPRRFDDGEVDPEPEPAWAVSK